MTLPPDQPRTRAPRAIARLARDVRRNAWGRAAINLSWLIVVGLLGTACSRPVTAGTVVDTRFVPAHEHHWMQRIPMGETCYGTGSSQYCDTNYMTIPQTQHIPDAWYITLESCVVEGNQQRCDHQEHTVDQATFDDAQIGDYFAAQTVEPSRDVYTDR